MPVSSGLVIKTAAVLFESAALKALTMESGSAGGYLGAQTLLRLALTAAVLVVAALVPIFNIWGAAAGIFTLQIAVYSLKFYEKKDGAADESVN